MKRTILLIAVMAGLLSPLAATITVESPNGGETLVRGTTWPIAWTATGVTQPVRIVLLKSGGGRFGYITDWISAGSSPYPWAVAATSAGEAPAGQYRVRVITQDGNDQGVSKELFTVAESTEPPPGGKPTLQLTAPSGGDWVYANTMNIAWTANWSGTLKLELWHGGSLKGVIREGVDATAGTYPWIVGQLKDGVPVEKTSGYRVRAVREYKAGKWTPIPKTPLQDETVLFSIVAPKMTEIQAIRVVKPVKDDVFFYNQYGKLDEPIIISVHWETDHPGPFQLTLCDMKGKDIKSLGTCAYKAKGVYFYRNEVGPGVYRIKVQTADLKHAGLGDRFNVKFKLFFGKAKPDLFICKLSPEKLVAGQANYRLVLRVMNKGNAPAERYKIWMNVQGTPVGVYEETVPLEPGKYRDAEWPAYPFKAPVHYHFKVDFENEVDELKEGNNELEGDMVINVVDAKKCSDEEYN
jgi:hypothetical protein